MKPQRRHCGIVTKTMPRLCHGGKRIYQENEAALSERKASTDLPSKAQ
jgi:hypothetical protein